MSPHEAAGQAFDGVDAQVSRLLSHMCACLLVSSCVVCIIPHCIVTIIAVNSCEYNTIQTRKLLWWQ